MIARISTKKEVKFTGRWFVTTSDTDTTINTLSCIYIDRDYTEATLFLEVEEEYEKEVKETISKFFGLTASVRYVTKTFKRNVWITEHELIEINNCNR